MEKHAMDLVRDGVLRIRDAEKLSGCGKTKLYEAMAAGELEYVKIGASRRIPRRALEMWLARGLMVGNDRVLPNG